MAVRKQVKTKVKTYKREVAVAQLLIHWILVGGVFYKATTDATYDLDALVDLVTALAIWVYGFAAAAFSLDSFAKQVTPFSRQKTSL